MNYNSISMLSALKELYSSDPMHSRTDLFMEILYKLDLSDFIPMSGLLAWLPRSNNSLFGLVPKNQSWQGGMIPVPLNYTLPVPKGVSTSKQANPKLNRAERRKLASQEGRKHK